MERFGSEQKTESRTETHWLVMLVNVIKTVSPRGTNRDVCPNVSGLHASHSVLSLCFFLSFTPSHFYLFKNTLYCCWSPSPTLILHSLFFYMHTYLSAAATDVSANTNETRRDEVGRDPEGMAEKEGDLMGDGQGRTDLGREGWSSVSVCVYAKSLGVHLTLSCLEQSRYCPPPPKLSPSCFAFSLGESHAWTQRSTHIIKNN